MMYKEKKAEHSQNPGGSISKWEIQISSQVYYITVAIKKQLMPVQESQAGTWVRFLEHDTGSFI